MNRVIGSELFKLRTTRTFIALVASALLLVIIPTVLICALANFNDSDNVADGLMFGLGTPVRALALVIGILAVTNEFRHGTITPTLLVAPDRVKLMLSKLVAALAAGLALGIASLGLILGISAAIGAARGFDVSSDGLALFVGGALSIALFTALGVGVGALIRNQVGAIVGALIYLLLAESLLGLIPGVDDVLNKYGIGPVSTALAGGNSNDTSLDLLGQIPAGLLLTGYVLVFLFVGILLFRRRDVTA
jgi:ABC-2 type transport system permease protein